MEKTKLTEARKSKGFSQSQMAEQLCMDVSNYNRREKGQTKISFPKWEKLSKILEIPIEDIYESEESHIVLFKDNAVGNYLSTNNIYSIPESLLDSQQKYITKLEEEITYLKKILEENKVLLSVTTTYCRLRKIYLNENDRKRHKAD